MMFLFSFQFGLLLVLMGYLNGECFASLLLKRRGRDPLRQDREYESPEISMSSISPHWFKIQCTIPKMASGFRVFVSCPALQSPCYENCQPSKNCSVNSSHEVECLPDKVAVNCSESTNPDGNKVTTIWIDKRSTRLHGSWACTSQGIKSSVVNVLPELEEREITPPAIQVPEAGPVYNETEGFQSEDITNAAGDTEVTTEPPYYAVTSFLTRSPWVFCLVSVFIISVTLNIILWCRWCLVCIFTVRRKKYNEDQKLLGEMICLPTQISRPHSGLWENDIYPNSFLESVQEPSYFKGNLEKFQHFGTFGPNNFAFDQSQIPHLGEFTDTAFPSYFSTIQPNQLWRTRSVGPPFSAGNFTMINDPTSRVRSITGSLKHLNSQNENLHLSPPCNLNTNPMKKDSEDLKRFHRITMNSAPTPAAVYDDVASSSTITVKSKDPQKSRKEPQLSSLVGLDKPKKIG